MTKSRYRFLFRSTTLFETHELEAGPFTPYEAAAFGQMEAAKRAALTGEGWVCNYSEIADAPPPPTITSERTSRLTIAAAVVITCLAFGYLIGWALAARFGT